jgi:hypothetical protein
MYSLQPRTTDTTTQKPSLPKHLHKQHGVNHTTNMVIQPHQPTMQASSNYEGKIIPLSLLILLLQLRPQPVHIQPNIPLCRRKSLQHPPKPLFIPTQAHPPNMRSQMSTKPLMFWALQTCRHRCAQGQTPRNNTIRGIRVSAHNVLRRHLFFEKRQECFANV